MSWNILAFAVPAVSFCKWLSWRAPSAYREFDRLPRSSRSEAVGAIVERILREENVQGGRYFQRIQVMLRNLPEKKTIGALVERRFGVVDVERDDFPVFSMGTDADEGKYFIGVSRGVEREELPWAIAHEVGHILEEDAMKIGLAKVAGSFAVAAVATGIFGCSWVSATGGAIVANVAVQVAGSQMTERRADDFAIRHCSEKELANGAALLEKIKAMRGKGAYSQDLMVSLFYPSEEERIAKIRGF